MSQSGACYNCGSFSHISLFCPEPPQWTRCMCTNVIYTEKCHKSTCGFKSYRSTRLEQMEKIAELNEFLRLWFDPVDRVVLCMDNDEKTMTDKPLWFSGANMLLKISDGNFIFEAPSKRVRNIVVVDQNNIRRMVIAVGHVFRVNEHYQISSQGDIKYNRFEEQRTDARVDCLLKVYLKQPLFYARVVWAGLTMFFDVYSCGVTFKDPVLLENLHNASKKKGNIYLVF